MYYIAKSVKGNRLSGFYPNDLPTRTKNGVSVKNIIKFSNNDYITFPTEQEAKDYCLYMLDSISDNAKRYNSIHWCADQTLIDIIGKLKIFWTA